MGRPYTGADTTTSAPRLELPRLLSAGYFIKNAEVSGTWTWSNGDRAEILTHWVGAEVYMDLTTRFEAHTGEMTEERQRIYLMRKPSNLGRGEVLYFRCPFTLRPCRILYRAYHSRTWRSREAFSYRLYYPAQCLSGWTRHMRRESNVEAKLDRLYSKKVRATYGGKPTRRALRIAQLKEEAQRLALLGWHPMYMPTSLRRAMEQGLDLGVNW